ncbi:MAG TPA: outer membrane beta-barrel protein [Gemmatimonadaceae bacterium]
MNRIVLSSLAAAAAIMSSSPAQAQGFNPFQIGASGGVALPMGDLKQVTNTGYNIALAVGLKSQFSPIGVRAEAAWNQFGFKNNVVGANGSINIPAFTGNIVLGLPIAMFSPYAIGGVGLYRPSASINGGGTSNSENDFGFNVGGGIKIPASTSFETFIEARYHRVNAQGGGTYTFVPITFGVMF